MVRTCQAFGGLQRPVGSECRGDKPFWILAYHRLGDSFLHEVLGAALSLHSWGTESGLVRGGSGRYRAVLGWPWEFLSHFRDFFPVYCV